MKATRLYLQLFAVALLLSVSFGCASVQSGRVLRSDWKITECHVYGIRSDFPGWPRQSEIPIKLGREVAAALNARGIKADFTESTRDEVSAVLRSHGVTGGTVMVIEGEQIVIERGAYSSAPNGISFHKLSVFEEDSGVLIAEYRLRVATGLGNFKSAEGGFRDTAGDFVANSINGRGLLTAQSH